MLPNRNLGNLMRIAVVHSAYSTPFPSGENSMVRMQVDALAEAGHEVVLFSSENDFASQGATYILSSAFRVATGLGNSPIQSIRSFNPEIVLVNNLFPNYGSSWLRKLDVPKVAILHNFRYTCAGGFNYRDGHQCFDCANSSPLSGLRHKCYRGSAFATLPLTVGQIRRNHIVDELTYFSKIVCISSAARDSLVQQGFAPGNLMVVPNFINRNSEIISRSKVEKNGKWIATGRLSQEKGFLNLVKSWPSQKELDIVGDGPEFEDLQIEIGSRKNIRLTGQMDRHSLLESLPFYLGAIHPSLWIEPHPLAVMEYLASALPIISLADNKSQPTIEEYSAGIVLEEFSSENILHSISTIENDYSHFSSGSSRTYQNNFTKDLWISRMNSIFRSLV